MKTLKWCKNSKDHAYMRIRKLENIDRCKNSKAEAWMAEKLKETGLNWTRQAQWGHRLFDFWNAHLGVAVEVDGPEHDSDYDAYRDEYNFRRSTIVVLRVPNFSETAAERAVRFIKNERTWKERRENLGVADMDERIALAYKPYPPSYLARYLDGFLPSDLFEDFG